MKALTSYRQSLLASMERCPRRTRADLEIAEDISVGYVEASADLGRVTHEVLAEIMRALRRQDEHQIPTQEAVEIMREVYMATKITLPADERDTLRMLVLQFCGYRFDPKRILAIEKPLLAHLECPDGKTRLLTGRPDLIMRDGDHGIVIVDWKSGQGRPKSPRVMPPEGEPIVGKKYLSDRGHFQLDCYSLLGLFEWVGAQYAILRELHLRSGEIREATLGREELEHVSFELAAQMQKIDQAIGEGDDSELWNPRPGKHCLRACPVAKSCPIPQEQRGLGSIDPSNANEQAARYVVVDALRQQLRDGLKTVHEEDDIIPEVGDGTGLFWRKNDKGKRDFGVWPLPNGQETADASD